MTIRHRMDVQAHLLEGQGGMIRILTDAERFGLSVRSINVDAAADDPALLCFSATFVSTTGAIDAAQLAARLARHSGGVRVECAERPAATLERVAA